MSDGWIELSFRVPAELVDHAADILFDLSGNGVCIDNQILDTFSLDTVAEPVTATVRSYFDDNADLEQKIADASSRVTALCAGYPGYVASAVEVKPVHQEDWATSWKQHFHSSPIGRRLLLKPSWEDVTNNEGRLVIEIDPGMAFGTGTHATTRLCLEALEKIFDRLPPYDLQLPATPPTVLDVGTGSGVLTIAARMLGAGRMIAVDIDPEAIAVARDNLQNNGISDNIELSTTPLNRINDRFAIILANILAEDLIRMAPDLTARLLPSGVIVLSGILVEREGGVLDAFLACGFEQVEITRQQEWSCIVLRRDN